MVYREYFDCFSKNPFQLPIGFRLQSAISTTYLKLVNANFHRRISNEGNKRNCFMNLRFKFAKLFRLDKIKWRIEWLLEIFWTIFRSQKHYKSGGPSVDQLWNSRDLVADVSLQSTMLGLLQIAETCETNSPFYSSEFQIWYWNDQSQF